jgi:hypothetical protein
MSDVPATQINHTDYEVIEAAVMETERGRWFLSEYAQRNRHADTQSVLSAIEKLHNSIGTTFSKVIPAADLTGENDGKPILKTIRQHLLEMAGRIENTHLEVAAIGQDEGHQKFVDLSSGGELDAIIASTEKATSEILAAAEEIQEIAWTLRESGLAVETCDAIDERATNIYLACSFQDLTAQRTTKFIETMRYLETHINAMLGGLQDAEIISVADIPAPPSKERNAFGLIEDGFTSLGQDDIDFALKWDRENGSSAGQPDIEFEAPAKQWLEETEIAETLGALEGQAETDSTDRPETNVVPANVVSANVATADVVSIAEGKTAATTAKKDKKSKLEDIDKKDVDSKLELFS